MNVNDVTGISVVCKTPELIKAAYLSFRLFYPDNRLIIVNGLADDEDETTQFLRGKEETDAALKVFYCPENIGHGPGMDLALQHCTTSAAYVFDSDTRMDRAPLAEMLAVVAKFPDWYAAGNVGAVDDKGFAGKPESDIPYVHPAIMLLSVPAYKLGPRFVEHGAPVISAMSWLHETGQSGRLIPFPVRDYVFHNWRGTRVITRKYL